MTMRLPGAAASAVPATAARAGTRCSAALTVVSSTVGLSIGSVSRGRVAMRCATIGACGETRS